MGYFILSSLFFSLSLLRFVRRLWFWSVLAVALVGWVANHKRVRGQEGWCRNDLRLFWRGGTLHFKGNCVHMFVSGGVLYVVFLLGVECIRGQRIFLAKGNAPSLQAPRAETRLTVYRAHAS